MNSIEKFCREIGMPEEECGVIGAAYLKVAENKEVYDVMKACVAVYEHNTDFEHKPIFEKIESLSGKAGLHKYTLDLVYMIMLVPHLKELYTENGISEDVLRNSVADLKWKSAECKKVYGVWGIFVGWWTIDFFKLKRFAFGRLQFNMGKFNADYNISGEAVKKEDIYIDTHIPSGKPLNYEECQLSYKCAAEFYKNTFKGAPIIFGCNSWLLSRDNKKILPETSNILKFASDYVVLEQVKDEKSTDAWRIFNVEKLPERLDDLPQETSMQRAFAKWLKAGNTIDEAFGAFIYPHRFRK